jgi:hypothetical protein
MCVDMDLFFVDVTDVSLFRYVGTRCGSHSASGAERAEACTCLGEKARRGQKEGKGIIGKDWFESASVILLMLIFCCNCCTIKANRENLLWSMNNHIYHLNCLSEFSRQTRLLHNTRLNTRRFSICLARMCLVPI